MPRAQDATFHRQVLLSAVSLAWFGAVRSVAVTDGAGWDGVEVRAADSGDAPFISDLADRLAAVSRLPWLPAEATDRFATEGCAEAVRAIAQPGHVVLIAAD